MIRPCLFASGAPRWARCSILFLLMAYFFGASAVVVAQGVGTGIAFVGLKIPNQLTGFVSESPTSLQDSKPVVIKNVAEVDGGANDNLHFSGLKLRPVVRTQFELGAISVDKSRSGKCEALDRTWIICDHFYRLGVGRFRRQLYDKGDLVCGCRPIILDRECDRYDRSIFVPHQTSGFVRPKPSPQLFFGGIGGYCVGMHHCAVLIAHGVPLPIANDQQGEREGSDYGTRPALYERSSLKHFLAFLLVLVVGAAIAGYGGVRIMQFLRLWLDGNCDGGEAAVGLACVAAGFVFTGAGLWFIHGAIDRTADPVHKARHDNANNKQHDGQERDRGENVHLTNHGMNSRSGALTLNGTRIRKANRV